MIILIVVIIGGSNKIFEVNSLEKLSKFHFKTDGVTSSLVTDYYRGLVEGYWSDLQDNIKKLNHERNENIFLKNKIYSLNKVIRSMKGE